MMELNNENSYVKCFGVLKMKHEADIIMKYLIQSAAICIRWFIARGFFYSEDEGDTFLRNVNLH
jgi:hypothetical protein